jgi:hypothetical protein
MLIPNGSLLRRTAASSLLAIAVLLLPAAAYASVPSVVNYQGRLTDNTPQQNPVDATVSVDFSVWDAASGGASLWTETQSVQVVKGLFNVLLGATTPIPPTVFTGGATRYLEIHVSGETLAPRQRIAATPFANAAASADDAASLGGLGASAYQRRVATPCPAGYAVNAVAADGTTTCIQGPQGPPGVPGAGLDTGAISGTVTTCTPPVTGVVVYVPGRSAVAYAAADGTYLLSYLPAGSYTVQMTQASAGVTATVNGVNVTSGQTTAAGTTNVQNVAVDPDNCGACGTPCSTSNISRVCAGGSCETGVCAPGYADCNGTKRADGCEANVVGSPSSCGGCGIVCSSNNVPAPTCAGGVCNGLCAPGFTDCNNNRQTDGCEVATASSPTNCGGCGTVCSSNHIPIPACTGGSCNGNCANGFADCNNNKQTDGCEISLSNDPSNCGACGLTCSSNHITPGCGGSICNGACAAGFADCNGNKQSDGCEINIAGDPTNCGGCGTVCSSNHVPSPTCGGGSCNGACATGFADCDGNRQSNGCEININSDNSNCGNCGHVCGGATPNCVGGICT